MMSSRAEVAIGEIPNPQAPSCPKKNSFQLSSDPLGTLTRSTARPVNRLFEAFVACRTTLDDLSSRAAAMGEDISGPVIAAHLTGKSCISGHKHNVVAAALNARLRELSIPAAAPYTNEFQGPAASRSSTLGIR
jgi:hypothetical protein